MSLLNVVKASYALKTSAMESIQGESHLSRGGRVFIESAVVQESSERADMAKYISLKVHSWG